ncbi:MAG: DUF3800 domain-containing protein [bacterium]|nr:DUF3800 domain-containing protein [bacterium]
MRYRLYVDESGDHVIYDRSTLSQEGHRFLALGGVQFEYGEGYNEFAGALETLKRKHLPYHADEPIILHRRDIIDKRGPFTVLQDEEMCKLFDEDLLKLLTDVPYELYVVVIDKLKHINENPNPWHPYHMALTYLMQRFSFHLTEIGGVGDILAESRGGNEDKMLKNAYEHTYHHGDVRNTSLLYHRTLTSKEIKLKPKNKNIAGLQLIDMLVANAKRWVLRKYDLTVMEISTFESRLVPIIESKFRSDQSGNIEGCGFVLYPK